MLAAGVGGLAIGVMLESTAGAYAGAATFAGGTAVLLIEAAALMRRR